MQSESYIVKDVGMLNEASPESARTAQQKVIYYLRWCTAWQRTHACSRDNLNLQPLSASSTCLYTFHRKFHSLSLSQNSLCSTNPMNVGVGYAQ
jgi:hypothetical protein